MADIINNNRKNGITAAWVFMALFLYCLAGGFSLMIPLLLVFYGWYLAMFRGVRVGRFLHLGLLLALLAASGQAMMEYSHLSAKYIPTAGVAMLTMMLFNDFQLAFSMSFISSALLSLAIGLPLEGCLIMFMGGLTGAYIVRDARTRGKVLLAGVFAGTAQAVAFFLAHPSFSNEVIYGGLRPLLLSGILSAAVVLVTLRIFESLFGELTHFSLLELSDSLTQPLLKRLALEAPGTYHHSLVLSNLAGAAADAIAANALLVRVGAYYHDIGKLVKPEYFNENQMMIDNKHDALEPSMSRLVILNHVKEGVEIARKYKLSPRLIDFIQQHHGTSLIYYFYQKAITEDETDSVQEENYRYPGPKPQTKEAAIIMLADSVEGATRSLDEHTPARISDLVRKVVNNKFIDGQLDACNLTLREIEAISGVFSRELSAMYHARVKYPHAKKTNGHHSKSVGDQDHADAPEDQSSR
ncbi:MAG: HDIG domain-containing metalloprotein [Candidatus Omnitrophota bacterium]